VTAPDDPRAGALRRRHERSGLGIVDESDVARPQEGSQLLGAASCDVLEMASLLQPEVAAVSG
jgi:hypothetical protein